MKNIPDLLQQNIDLQKIVADKDDIICAQEKSLQEKEQSLHNKEKRIRILEEYILSLQQKQFGSSSEKQEVIQAELVFTEAEGNAEAEVPAQRDAFSDEPVIVVEHKRKKKRVSSHANSALHCAHGSQLGEVRALEGLQSGNGRFKTNLSINHRRGDAAGAGKYRMQQRFFADYRFRKGRR